MHAKSAGVTQFLEKDLLPQVKAAFAGDKPADKAAIGKDPATVVPGIEDDFHRLMFEMEERS